MTERTSETPEPGLSVVNLATGEQLECLDQQPAETLAEALDAVRRHQTQAKEWAAALEGELRKRLQVRGRKRDIAGGWELQIEESGGYEWDADDAEDTLRRFVEAGVLRAGELTGVVTHETVVHKREMNVVLGRLADAEQAELKQYRRWVPRGVPRVRVTRSVPLLAANENEQLSIGRED